MSGLGSPPQDDSPMQAGPHLGGPLLRRGLFLLTFQLGKVATVLQIILTNSGKRQGKYEYISMDSPVHSGTEGWIG